MKNLRKARLEPVDASPDGLTELVSMLKSLYGNGDVIFRKYAVPETRVGDIASIMAKGKSIALLQSSPGFLQGLPEPFADVDPDASIEMGVFDLEGFLVALARALETGSAYNKLTPPEVERATALFRAIMLDGQASGDVVVNFSRGSWNGWFFDIFWDYTCVVLNKTARCLWLVAITDQD